MKHKVSVIMACYNEEKEWVRESINSILGQSFDDFEYIIVLDNPNNKLLRDYLEEIKKIDDRIKLIINDKNEGLVSSLNKAIEYSTGEYIARMDSDDISMKDRLEIQYEYLENNPEISLISSKAIIINENGEELYKTNDFANTPDSAKRSLFYRNTFFHPSWMFRRSILEKVKGYNNLPRTEDLDFLCRTVISGYKIINIPHYLIKYRVRENGISSSGLLQQVRVARTIMNSYKCSITQNKEYSSDKILENIYTVKDRDIELYSKACKLHTKAIHDIRNHKYFIGFIELLKSMFLSKDKAMDIYNTIRIKMLN
ncbi:MAG: glycosyltransferase [Clostridium sp.]|uniref:glycosyltransferase n=1 Tax=Clostridium sp. TaxID=1506 RepID=UPI001EBDCC25|nr:glycosyltransferase [Clostridium sp.]MBS5885592.1 glycosyltransferase [Clostridium sp.]MDU7149287.1 glycosyltransferase [Clostridium sp.]